MRTLVPPRRPAIAAAIASDLVEVFMRGTFLLVGPRTECTGRCLIVAKKIATDETNVAAEWIADQPDESSRIHSARLSLEPEIGYEIIFEI